MLVHNYVKTLSAIILITFFSAVAFAQAGELDNTFSGDGIVTTVIGAIDDEAIAIAIQSDGKLIAAGFSNNGTDYDFGLVRYNADGILDNTFGTDGIITTPIGSSGDWAYSVAIQSDGKILAAGRSWNGTNSHFALVRYNSDGSLDTNFGTDGIVSMAIGLGDDGINSLAIQVDGKIIAGGYSGLAPNYDFAMVRFTSNGILDNSFGTGGKVITSVASGEDFVTDVALQSDGKLIAAGFSNNGTNGDFALLRYNADGTLDNGFGSGGKVTTDIGLSDDLAASVVIQVDDKIIAAGHSGNYPDYDFAMVRYNADGTMDNSFNTDGQVTTAISLGNDEAFAVTLQPDGKIVAAGYSFNGNYCFTLVRYNASGTLDDSFGSAGILITSISSGSNVATSVAIQSDGKIVVAGNSCSSTTCSFAIARYLSGLNMGIINFSSSQSSPLIYPNPIHQTEMLEYILAQDETLTISLYNVNGEWLKDFITREKRIMGLHSEQLNMGTLPAGNYILILSNGKRQTNVKLVKQ